MNSVGRSWPARRSSRTPPPVRQMPAGGPWPRLGRVTGGNQPIVRLLFTARSRGRGAYAPGEKRTGGTGADGSGLPGMGAWGTSRGVTLLWPAQRRVARPKRWSPGGASRKSEAMESPTTIRLPGRVQPAAPGIHQHPRRQTATANRTWHNVQHRAATRPLRARLRQHPRLAAPTAG
jgi:hypothetical protein